MPSDQKLWVTILTLMVIYGLWKLRDHLITSGNAWNKRAEKARDLRLKGSHESRAAMLLIYSALTLLLVGALICGLIALWIWL